MKLELNTDQLAVRDAVASALKGATSDRLREVWGKGYLTSEYDSLGEMGMLGFLAGESEYGGGPIEACVVAEQLGQHAAITPVLASVVQAAGALRESAHHVSAYAALIEGRMIASWAAPESGHRPDRPAALAATMNSDGLTLTGVKAIVEWAPHAELLVVTGRLGGETVVAAVATTADGLTITRRATNTGGEIAKVEFADVQVAGADVIARGPEAGQLIADVWKRTLLFQSAYLLGIGSRAIDLTIGHAKVREQFGRPIGAFQAVKHAIADSHIALLAARLMIFETASRDGFDASLQSLAELKAWIAEAATQAVRVAHEIHGGLGAVDDHEVSLLFRRALGEAQLFGSSSELWEFAAEARSVIGADDRRPAH